MPSLPQHLLSTVTAIVFVASTMLCACREASAALGGDAAATASADHCHATQFGEERNTPEDGHHHEPTCGHCDGLSLAQPDGTVDVAWGTGAATPIALQLPLLLQINHRSLFATAQQPLAAPPKRAQSLLRQHCALNV